jgi:Nif-specific regulatory protein
VRELQNVIERAVILCNEGGQIEPETLGLPQRGATFSASAVGAAAAPPITSEAGALPLAEIEKRHILAVLEVCKGNRTHAARLLDISIRTLRNKLNEYNYRGAQDGSDGDAPDEAAV